MFNNGLYFLTGIFDTHCRIRGGTQFYFGTFESIFSVCCSTSVVSERLLILLILLFYKLLDLSQEKKKKFEYNRNF